MTTSLVAAAVAVVALPAGRVLAAVRGGEAPSRRAPRVPGAGAWVMLTAGLVALPTLVGGGGDLVIAGALVAAATAGRSPAVPLGVVLVAVAAALRVGSALGSDVGGAHAVLGPALLSPLAAVWLPAAFAAAAGLLLTVHLVPAPATGPVLRPAPERAAAVLAPVLVALLVMAAVAGSPLASDGLLWPAVRWAGLVAGLLVAAAARRVVPARLVENLPLAAVGLAAAAAAAALVTA